MRSWNDLQVNLLGLRSLVQLWANRNLFHRGEGKEATGGGACREADVLAFEHGVLAVAAMLGIVPADMAPATRRPRRVLRQRERGKSCLNALTASQHDGIWISRVRLLQRVRSGDVLGQIRALDGRCLDNVRSPTDGQVILLRHSARVKHGEWLFCLA